MPYKLIDALEEPELATKYGVKMAPTLVVDNGSNVKMYVRASEIKQYVDENKKVLA
jgi:ribonucleoside-triphosphate reductase